MDSKWPGVDNLAVAVRVLEARAEEAAGVGWECRAFEGSDKQHTPLQQCHVIWWHESLGHALGFKGRL